MRILSAEYFKKFLLIFLCFTAVFSKLAYSKTVSSEKKYKNLSQTIKQKIKSKSLSSHSLGIVISKVQKDNTIAPLYSLNENKLFTPASLAKIATLYALYAYYPSSYTFKTSFISSALLKNGVLHGDLILKGGGDSSFTSESLWNLINILKRSGIKNIKGSLLVDDSLYKKSFYLPLSERSYFAPASASSFNWNSVAFYIRPGKSLKSPARVFSDPENSYIQIKNKVKTGNKNKIHIQRKHFSKGKELFEIKGEININEEELVKYRNIIYPDLWLGHNAISFLKQRGITVSGSVKKGSCSGHCRVLAEWESRPFSFHSYNLMKYSSNFTAQMLVSHLALLKGSKKGDKKQGMKWINSYLKKEGFKNFRLKEPSGLDRGNKFSPKDLQEILNRISVKFQGIEQIFSYPLAGGKGTLNKKLKKRPPFSFIRAKTGSLYGVLGLAGWAGQKDTKTPYIFVFIFNGKAEKSPKAEELFEEILLSLLS